MKNPLSSYVSFSPVRLIPLLMILGLSLLLCVFMSACGFGKYHVIYQQNPTVADRATGTECEMVYFQMSDSEVKDVYGPPCNVVLKRKVSKQK